MAKSKFSISEGMLNSISKNIDKSNLIDAKENFKFDYIDIDKLKVNNKNFYPIIDIETLAEDISINGLNHNLVIRPIEDGFYEIISGERRYSALKSLVDKGDNKYSKVPCKIVNLNDVDSEITLIQANAQTRELSDADKLKQIERLTELYKEKKKNGEKVTNIRKLVSKDIGLSEGQVAKYSTVSNNLIPELRTILDEGNLSISNATEFSSLSEENQKIILDIINKRVDISRNEAVEIKKQLKEIELEKNRIIEREKQKSEEILKLKSENETKSIEIDTKIEQVKKEILEREELSSTGFGNGIAIPHAKTSAVKIPRVAVGISKDGFDFDSVDGNKANLIFMIAAGDDDNDLHLKTLSHLAQNLMDDEFVKEILNSKSKKEIVQLLSR